MARQPVNRLGREQIRAVLQRALQTPAAILLQRQRQIELRRRRFHHQRLHLQPRQLPPRCRGVLQHKQHLKQRAVTPAPFRLQLGHQLGRGLVVTSSTARSALAVGDATEFFEQVYRGGIEGRAEDGDAELAGMLEEWLVPLPFRPPSQ